MPGDASEMAGDDRMQLGMGHAAGVALIEPRRCREMAQRWQEITAAIFNKLMYAAAWWQQQHRILRREQ